jgi:amidase
MGRDDQHDNGRGIGRRTVLRVGALTGVAALGRPLTTVLGAHGGADGQTLAPPAFDLDEATIDALHERMASGQETSRSLVEKYISRIEAIDQQGPTLRSVLEVNPDARAIADQLDAERKERGARGPLHGIPVLFKDNIETADRMQTTAGSLALAGSKPARDAFVAERLRAVGAVILGKTNLSEWANFRSTHSSSGWSARGGQCRNPYALDRNPSGSSSGSGAAVAANLTAVAIGTETDGSIVSPSNNCSLVGFKPTVGLVSRAGIIPIAHSQDTAGPMTRTVRDAAILLSAIAGADPRDPVTRTVAARGTRDYMQCLDPGGLKGARIGVPRKALFGYSPAADRLAEAALAEMKRMGAVIVDPADIATVDQIGRSESLVLRYEFKADLNAHLAARGAGTAVRSLKDLIAFNDQNRDREMPYFGQEIFVQADAKGPLTTPAYTQALAACRRLSRTLGIDQTMTKYRLDALVAPTSGPPSLTDLVNGDYGPDGSSSPAAVAGYPHITVPMGYERGLPVGLSFFGRAFSEPVLLRLAYAFEQATKHRQPPRFLSTAAL